MNKAISVQNLSKKYQFYSKPVDRLKELMTRGKKAYHQDFWALHDVSFEVPRGQTVGVVGRNGSGKSTLLQILAGTLQPSAGEVVVNGRVSALLELGAGFNPEFTGRENVFINGAIMGFNQAEMEERFPRICAFAEIGNFIDQPVKTYSSGMYVRLAFATAINVDPDILLVDEALSVGDAVFQYRCMRRIQELRDQGVTIFFVSHDLSAIKSLCDHALLIDRGRLVNQGEPYSIINQYQGIVMAAEESLQVVAVGAGEVQGSFRHGNQDAEIVSVDLVDDADCALEVVASGDPVTVRVCVRIHRSLESPVVGIMLRNRMGLDLYGTNTELQDLPLGPVEAGEELAVRFRLNAWLGQGDYAVTVAVHTADGLSCDWVDDAVFLKVLGTRKASGLTNLNAELSAGRPGRAPESLSER